MSLPLIIIAVVAGVLLLMLVELWSRRQVARATERVLERARHRDQIQSEPAAPLKPESRFVVRLSDLEVVCERPDGKVERVAWSDLQKVEVVTTSAGFSAPDLFWVLHGTAGGCAVPQGATGDKELVTRLQALPGFNNQAVIEAMSCAADRRFLCWERAA